MKTILFTSAALIAWSSSSFACGEGACRSVVAECAKGYRVLAEDGPAPFIIERPNGTEVTDHHNFISRDDGRFMYLKIDGHRFSCQAPPY